MFTRKGLIANSTRSGLFGVLAALLALVLSACGGGGSGGSGSGVGGTGGGAVTYTLGGSISGLNGSGLVLTLMGGSQSVFPTSGAASFTFPNALVSGTTYDVKVSASPAGLTCSVAKGSGTIGSANVSNVVVTCANAAYTLSGSIQGLAAAGLVLSEGFDNLSLASGATSFTFPTSIAAGSSYLVTVRTQPQGMTCTVAYGTGIISANVTNVTVTCVVETVLYSFGTGVSGDGLSSRAGLIQDSQGNLYGTTSWGGANGGGTIFKLAPPSGAQTAWTETVLYSFGTNGSADALQPRAGLVQDTQGNLYGTTSGGGAYSSGTVFKLAPPTGAQTAWTEAVLYSFDNAVSANGSDPEAGVIQDSQGNLYGTTFFGGAFSGGVIFELAPPTGGQTAWTETVLYSFGASGSSDGGESSASLIQDSQGSLYGTTQYGGAIGNGTVFKLAPPTGAQTAWTETVLYSFGTNGSADGFHPWAGVTQDAQGNLYGTTQYGGANGNGTVFKLAPPTGGQSVWAETVLYSFIDYSTGDGINPVGSVIRDSQGSLYGTTPESGPYSGTCGSYAGGGIVFKLSPPSGAQSAWTETVLYGFLGSTGIPDGCGSVAGLTQDSKGNLYGTTLYGGANGTGTVFEIVP